MEDPRFKAAVYFVETPDGCIVDYLKDKWTGAVRPVSGPPRFSLLRSWEMDGAAPLVVAGNTALQCRFAKIDGHVVCFYEPTGLLVNWADVEAWRTTNFPRVPNTTADRFYEVAVMIAREKMAGDKK